MRDPITHPFFGLLTSEGELFDWWKGLMAWTPKHVIHVYINHHPDENETADDRLEWVQKMYERVRAAEWSHRLGTARAMLQQYNQLARQRGEREETPESFARQLELHSFVLYPDGDVELVFDGDRADRFFPGRWIIGNVYLGSFNRAYTQPDRGSDEPATYL